MQITLIAVFGVLGVLSRFGLDRMLPTEQGQFPWSTFVTNLLGCALAGGLLGLFEKQMLTENLQIALLVGFCGGFTTFSAYGIQTLSLWEKSRGTTALIYFLASPSLGVLAALAGIMVIRKFVG